MCCIPALVLCVAWSDHRGERVEAERYNQEVAKAKKELLDLRSELSNEFSKARVTTESKLKQDRVTKMEAESAFNSSVWRAAHPDPPRRMNEWAATRIDSATREKMLPMGCGRESGGEKGYCSTSRVRSRYMCEGSACLVTFARCSFHLRSA